MLTIKCQVFICLPWMLLTSKIFHQLHWLVIKYNFILGLPEGFSLFKVLTELLIKVVPICNPSANRNNQRPTFCWFFRFLSYWSFSCWKALVAWASSAFILKWYIHKNKNWASLKKKRASKRKQIYVQNRYIETGLHIHSYTCRNWKKYHENVLYCYGFVLIKLTYINTYMSHILKLFCLGKKIFSSKNTR